MTAPRRSTPRRRTWSWPARSSRRCGQSRRRAATAELRALAQRKTPSGATSLLRERPLVQAKLGLAEATLRSARLLLYDAVAEAWERTLAGEEATLEQKADLSLAAAYAMQSAV